MHQTAGQEPHILGYIRSRLVWLFLFTLRYDKNLFLYMLCIWPYYVYLSTYPAFFHLSMQQRELIIKQNMSIYSLFFTISLLSELTKPKGMDFGGTADNGTISCF